MSPSEEVLTTRIFLVIEIFRPPARLKFQNPVFALAHRTLGIQGTLVLMQTAPCHTNVLIINRTMALSVVVITRDAGAQLEACLSSASFAQEILVVDSGSTDETLVIARRFGARIVEKEWLGFGLQKQFAVDAAANDWVLCLDADEVVSESLKLAILKVLAAPGAMAYEMSRCNRFLGRWLRHGEGYPDWSLRLFHRANARWSEDTVHEKVVPDAKPARLRGDLLHASAESIERYLEKQNRYTSLQAAQLLASGKKAGGTRLLLSPALRFLKFYFLRLGFLDGLPGLIHVSLGCMNSFNKYAKLLELLNSARQKT